MGSELNATLFGGPGDVYRCSCLPPGKVGKLGSVAKSRDLLCVDAQNDFVLFGKVSANGKKITKGRSGGHDSIVNGVFVCEDLGFPCVTCTLP